MSPWRRRPPAGALCAGPVSVDRVTRRDFVICGTDSYLAPELQPSSITMIDEDTDSFVLETTPALLLAADIFACGKMLENLLVGNLDNKKPGMLARLFTSRKNARAQASRLPPTRKRADLSDDAVCLLQATQQRKPEKRPTAEASLQMGFMR